MDKNILRKEIRQRKRRLSRQQLEEMSLPVIQRLLSHPRVRAARTLLLYCSLPDEVDTRQALRVLAGEGKRVLLPVVVADGCMVLRQYASDADLREGAFHIMEPVGPVFQRLDEIDVAVVPGMAFDAAGHRLGRGKGFYDRFLPLCQQAWRIGLCFGFQLLPSVPADAHDVLMDEIVSSMS